MAESWTTQTVPNVALAVAVGVLTAWSPPDRWPRWVRGAVHSVAVAAPVGAALFATGESANDDPPMAPVPRAAIAVAAGAAGLGLSVGGNRLDAGLEHALVRRGVSRPRWWMGAGACVLSLILWQIDVRTDSALPAYDDLEQPSDEAVEYEE